MGLNVELCRDGLTSKDSMQEASDNEIWAWS